MRITLRSILIDEEGSFEKGFTDDGGLIDDGRSIDDDRSIDDGESVNGGESIDDGRTVSVESINEECVGKTEKKLSVSSKESYDNVAEQLHSLS